MGARDPDELASKLKSYQGRVLDERRKTLISYLATARQQAEQGSNEDAQAYEWKIVRVIERRVESNEALWAIYNGMVSEAEQNLFFEISTKSWTQSIPNALSKLEKAFQGPYTFGNQLVSDRYFLQSFVTSRPLPDNPSQCLADLHIISWLHRIVSIAGGKPDASGMNALQGQLDDWIIGPGVKRFWRSWTARESFQRVLVPASVEYERTRGTSRGLLETEARRMPERFACD